jgi:hypothetical protein
MFGEKHKKEMPLLGMLGLGGGVGSNLSGGAAPIQASGGTKTTSGVYTIHTFTSNDNFVVSSGSGTVDVLVIGGGGGGGKDHYTGGSGGYNGRGTGGGGAGTLKYFTGLPLEPGTYPATIGNGGQGAPNPNQDYVGNDGQTTSFGASPLPFHVVSPGGGGGGGSGPGPNYAGRPGGSSGGSSNGQDSPAGTAATGHPQGVDQVSPPIGWGNKGGNGIPSEPYSEGGGGGGAGAAGNNGGGNPRGDGGVGATYTISGSPVMYAGGGGAGGRGGSGNGGETGGVWNGSSVESGGPLAGAGAGGSSPGGDGSNASANTGSGGGGAGTNPPTSTAGTGGNGGSGIVIVRYLT